MHRIILCSGPVLNSNIIVCSSTLESSLEHIRHMGSTESDVLERIFDGFHKLLFPYF